MIVVVTVFRKIVGLTQIIVILGLEVKFNGVQPDHDQFGTALVTRNDVTLFRVGVNVNVLAAFWTV
jgi:hypothetical protein